MKNKLRDLRINCFSFSKINIFYLILSVFFFIRVFYLFKFPIREDELSHLRYAANLAYGYIPFYDFFDIYLPLFNIILTPFIFIFKFDHNIVFYVRLFMVVYFQIGLLFYYKLLKKYFSNSVAIIATILFTSSVVFFMESMEIRQFHLSFPTYIIFLYYIIQDSWFTKRASIVSGIVLFIILSMDHRSAIFIAVHLFVYRQYKIENRKIMYLSFFFLVTSAISLIWSFDSRVLIAFFNVARTMAGKSDLISPYNFKLLLTDISFYLIPFACFLHFFKRTQSKLTIFNENIVLFFILLILIFSKRPNAIYVYILPYFSVKISDFYMYMVKRRFNGRWINFGIILILFTNLIIYAEVKNRSFNDLLQREMIMLKIINSKVKAGQRIMNLSRFQFDIFGKYISPFAIQVEEDVTCGLKKLKIMNYFNEQILGLLETRKYNYIIYDEKDYYLNSKISNFIKNEYHKISWFLYENNQISASLNYDDLRKDNVFRCSNFLSKIANIKVNNL